MLKGMTKHEDKGHGKTLKHEAPRSINYKATQNKLYVVVIIRYTCICTFSNAVKHKYMYSCMDSSEQVGLRCGFVNGL